MRTLNNWDWYVYDEMFTGEPDAGKLHVRFDEGCRRERRCLATAARRAYSTVVRG
jgi:hypothetical protein